MVRTQDPTSCPEKRRLTTANPAPYPGITESEVVLSA
jgi:hypothetical protein